MDYYFSSFCFFFPHQIYFNFCISHNQHYYYFGCTFCIFFTDKMHAHASLHVLLLITLCALSAPLWFIFNCHYVLYKKAFTDRNAYFSLTFLCPALKIPLVFFMCSCFILFLSISLLCQSPAMKTRRQRQTPLTWSLAQRSIKVNS